jgi:hypothetical protein
MEELRMVQLFSTDVHTQIQHYVWAFRLQRRSMKDNDDTSESKLEFGNDGILVVITKVDSAENLKHSQLQTRGSSSN